MSPQLDLSEKMENLTKELSFVNLNMVRLEGKLQNIQSDVAEIKTQGLPRCAEHATTIKSLQWLASIALGALVTGIIAIVIRSGTG